MVIILTYYAIFGLFMLIFLRVWLDVSTKSEMAKRYTAIQVSGDARTGI